MDSLFGFWKMSQDVTQSQLQSSEMPICKIYVKPKKEFWLPKNKFLNFLKTVQGMPDKRDYWNLTITMSPHTWIWYTKLNLWCIFFLLDGFVVDNLHLLAASTIIHSQSGIRNLRNAVRRWKRSSNWSQEKMEVSILRTSLRFYRIMRSEFIGDDCWEIDSFRWKLPILWSDGKGISSLGHCIQRIILPQW